MATDNKISSKNLHPLEVKVLLFYKREDELIAQKIEKELELKPGNGNQALSWLAGKNLVTEVKRETAVYYELTGIGELWKDKGSPEERILELVKHRLEKIKSGEKLPGLALPDISQLLGIENKGIGSAFGSLSKLNILKLDENKNVVLTIPLENLQDPAKNAALTRFSLIRGIMKKAVESGGVIAESSLLEEEKILMAEFAKKRAAADSPYRLIDRETVIFKFTIAKDGSCPAEDIAVELKKAGITGEEIGQLTVQMLDSGSWKGKTFRPYNVNIPPVRLLPGRMNPYAKFLEDVKDKLVSLGFEEFDGPLVETEFWNSDALFMPQFHSARDIHDVYRIADDDFDSKEGGVYSGGFAQAKSIDEPWLTNVALAHETGGKTGSRGWNYQFDREFTKRLILRSQGTVLSAKTLPNAKVPGKYFGTVRCFRYDQVDATHLPDFYQTEGIVLGEDVNLRTLLGMLEMFAREVAGADEVKFVPGYFPFTEPSVEVHIKHPILGWFELGGSGIFRPEVTSSLGVDVPVAAWGLGIDRMALMVLGINDIRELFTYDIENVRIRRTKEIKNA